MILREFSDHAALVTCLRVQDVVFSFEAHMLKKSHTESNNLCALFPYHHPSKTYIGMDFGKSASFPHMQVSKKTPGLGPTPWLPHCTSVVESNRIVWEARNLRLLLPMSLVAVSVVLEKSSGKGLGGYVRWWNLETIFFSTRLTDQSFTPRDLRVIFLFAYETFLKVLREGHRSPCMLCACATVSC